MGALGFGSRRARAAAALLLALVCACDATSTGPPREPGARAGADGRCGSRPLVIAANEEIAGGLAEALGDVGCGNVSVEPRHPDQVRDQLGSPAAPVLWVPDSETWLPPGGGRVLAPSLATTPVVIGRASGPPPRSWAAALTSRGLRAGDPLETMVSAGLVLLGTDGVPRPAADRELRTVARRQAAQGYPRPRELDLLEDIEFLGHGVTAVSEEQLLVSARDVRASVPASGTWLFRYPLVLTSDDPAVAAQAELVARAVQLPAVRRRLALSHFRDVDGDPVRGGVGDVRILAMPDPAAYAAFRDRWSGLVGASRPGRAVPASVGGTTPDLSGWTRP